MARFGIERNTNHTVADLREGDREALLLSLASSLNWAVLNICVAKLIRYAIKKKIL